VTWCALSVYGVIGLDGCARGVCMPVLEGGAGVGNGRGGSGVVQGARF